MARHHGCLTIRRKWRQTDMANNALPKSVSQAIGLGTRMNQGLITYGSELKITQVSQPDFQADVEALTSFEATFNSARTARQASADAGKPAELALFQWLQSTRNVLAARYGNRWSAQWNQAGFNNATTMVPKRLEDRLALAAALAAFFTANPTQEVKQLEITAAEATRLRNATLTTQEATTAADIVLKTKGTARDNALAKMLANMRQLVSILDATLTPSDPRWLQFGLQMPSTSSTPGKPVNVRVAVDENGALVVQCDPVARALRYRWRLLVVGVETDYRLVASTVEPFALITGVVAGQRVQIIVQAVNGNAQSVASDAVV